MRKIITENPYRGFFNPKEGKPYEEGKYWPCSWISYNTEAAPPYVLAFRRKFSMDSADTVTVHVSADERYELYIDGNLIGRGSERGDKRNWFYETYMIDFSQGSHEITARVWALGDFKPWAQVSVYPGFIFSPDGEKYINLMGTGTSEWQVMKMPGYSFLSPEQQCGYGCGSGFKVSVDGSLFPWGFEYGSRSDMWETPVVRDCGNSGFIRKPVGNVHVMRPAVLPPMLEKPVNTGKVRHMSVLPDGDVRLEPISEKNNILSDENPLKNILTKRNITVPPNRRIRLIIDLENYYCAYPKLNVSGGKGSCVKISWAESLFESADLINHTDKGNRDEIKGKYFKGTGDTFYPDGGENRTFDTLWWEAGRYVEFIICTESEPLVINSFALTETRYPFKPQSVFESDDKRLEQIVPAAVRTLQMCAHETYMDCPYYEQLMYIGDSRPEVLVTYALTKDDRLPKKALMMFNAAREGYGGLTACAYPENSGKVIPSFSLWWIGMLYDYSMWRDDINFVKSLMVGVRAVAEKMLSCRNGEGLIVSPGGWDYIDWSQNPSGGWYCGVAPDSDTGVNSILNWQAVYIFTLLSKLESYVGESELSKRMKRIADEMAEVITEKFWDDKKGMFSDDPEKENFSEHAQCMAILSGKLDENRRKRVFECLISADYLARTSIFYSHYLFETFCVMNRTDLLIRRLEGWFALDKYGFKTFPEYIGGKSRSDCHAWSSHPLFHYYATILGIRPATHGFKTVLFTPRLGGLKYAKGTMVHPKGEIKAEYSVFNGKFTAKLTLPEGITGVMFYGNREFAVSEGENHISVDISCGQ